MDLTEQRRRVEYTYGAYLEMWQRLVIEVTPNWGVYGIRYVHKLLQKDFERKLAELDLLQARAERAYQSGKKRAWRHICDQCEKLEDQLLI